MNVTLNVATTSKDKVWYSNLRVPEQNQQKNHKNVTFQWSTGRPMTNAHFILLLSRMHFSSFFFLSHFLDSKWRNAQESQALCNSQFDLGNP